MEETTEKKSILKPLIILFAVVLPALLVILGFWLFFQGRLPRKPTEEAATLPTGVLKPSQLVENKAQYKGESLTLRGKVIQAPMVCERQDCPQTDPCCGCKPERNLVISDADVVLVQGSVWRLRLLDSEGKAFCQRVPNSCQYDCPGWEMNGVYDVTGIFFAEPPPPGTGWRVYFDFYFQVNKKELVGRTSIWNLPGRIVRGIGELFKQLFAKGSYVLP